MVRHGKEPPADDATQVTTQEGRWRAGVNRQSQPSAQQHQSTAGLASGAKRKAAAMSEEVLGDWLREATLQPEGKEYEYPRMPEDNLKEMNEKESAFKPGGMFGCGKFSTRAWSWASLSWESMWRAIR